jgi:predicted 3-demethylubiquinone-9 3-methyltransferase (glyoxalase superfamily)
MQKITTHLWFDKEAKQAAEFYVAAFGKGSKVTSSSNLDNTPSGSVDIVTFELLGREFQAISAGPFFKFNPSVSFHVLSNDKEEVDAIWKKLLQGGTVLMELGVYPFSERYGWVQDRFGLSWQLFYSAAADAQPKITPVLMFVGSNCGRAEAAVNYWTSLFEGSNVYALQRFGKGEGPDQEGTLRYGAFSLLGQEFGAMDSAHAHDFAFNEAISFIVPCDTQEEIDYLWNKLSAVPEAEQCGWLKDQFGLSWQIVPTALGELMSTGSQEQTARVTAAFLQMKKFDIEGLKRAYQGDFQLEKTGRAFFHKP